MIQHTVTQRDTLESLSVRYQVPVCMILRANIQYAENLMRPGRRIHIPMPDFCTRLLGQASYLKAVNVKQGEKVTEIRKPATQDAPPIEESGPEDGKILSFQTEFSMDASPSSVYQAQEANGIETAEPHADKTADGGAKLYIQELSEVFELKEHIVQEGETVYTIAQMYETVMHLVLGINGVCKPEELQAGSKITVPCTTEAFGVYTVAMMDSMKSICEVLGVSEEILWNYNDMTGGIYPGMQLIYKKQ